jgi:hypothetical protein
MKAGYQLAHKHTPHDRAPARVEATNIGNSFGHSTAAAPASSLQPTSNQPASRELPQEKNGETRDLFRVMGSHPTQLRTSERVTR